MVQFIPACVACAHASISQSLELPEPQPFFSPPAYQRRGQGRNATRRGDRNATSYDDQRYAEPAFAQADSGGHWDYNSSWYEEDGMGASWEPSPARSAPRRRSRASFADSSGLGDLGMGGDDGMMYGGGGGTGTYEWLDADDGAGGDFGGWGRGGGGGYGASQQRPRGLQRRSRSQQQQESAWRGGGEEGEEEDGAYPGEGNAGAWYYGDAGADNMRNSGRAVKQGQGEFSGLLDTFEDGDGGFGLQGLEELADASGNEDDAAAAAAAVRPAGRKLGGPRPRVPAIDVFGEDELQDMMGAVPPASAGAWSSDGGVEGGGEAEGARTQ